MYTRESVSISAFGNFNIYYSFIMPNYKEIRKYGKEDSGLFIMSTLEL